MSCEQLLNSDWMKELQEQLIQEIVKDDHGEVSEIHKIAKASMKSLICFNDKECGQVKFDDLAEEDQKRIIMKESCLALIAHLFMDSKQKITLRKIFKIMDDSGDGKLEGEELRTGFTKVFNSPEDVDDDGRVLYQKIWTDQELNKIISKVDHDGNGYIDWKDFLLASVDLSA